MSSSRTYKKTPIRRVSEIVKNPGVGFITSDAWGSGTTLAFPVGPDSVTLDLSRYGGFVRTKNGGVTMVWPSSYPQPASLHNPRQTMAHPKMTLSLQTGNIIPVYSDEAKEVLPAPGVSMIYQLFELMAQDPISSSGRMNRVQVSFTSPIFNPAILGPGTFHANCMLEPDGMSLHQSSDDMQQTIQLSLRILTSRPDLATMKSISVT
jgi:hypothetical protein